MEAFIDLKKQPFGAPRPSAFIGSGLIRFKSGSIAVNSFAAVLDFPRNPILAREHVNVPLQLVFQSSPERGLDFKVVTVEGDIHVRGLVKLARLKDRSK